MSCISPPELNDVTLLKFIDGDAGDEVAAHLERCSHCRTRMRRLAAEQRRLMRLMYRATCPSSDTLGEYRLGMLADADVGDVRAHLTECPHCTRELSQLEDFLHALTPDVEHSRVEQVRVLVARLIGGAGDMLDGASVGAMPAFAGVRGEGENAYLYEAGDVEVVVQVQEQTDAQERRTVLGMVMGLPGDEREVHLWHEDRYVTSVPVDELDTFVLPDVAPGTYELILSGDEIEVHVHELNV